MTARRCRRTGRMASEAKPVSGRAEGQAQTCTPRNRPSAAKTSGGQLSCELLFVSLGKQYQPEPEAHPNEKQQDAQENPQHELGCNWWQQLPPVAGAHAGRFLPARTQAATHAPKTHVKKNPKRPIPTPAIMARTNRQNIARVPSGGGSGTGSDDDAIHTTSCAFTGLIGGVQTGHG